MTSSTTQNFSASLATYVPELDDADRRSMLADVLSTWESAHGRIYGNAVDRRARASALLKAGMKASVNEPDPRFRTWITELVNDWLEPFLPSVMHHRAVADPETVWQTHSFHMVNIASEALIRTVVEFMGERRDSDALHGDSPEGRFVDFAEWLTTRDGMDQLADRYPAAVIRAHLLLKRRTEFLVEILDCFVRDIEEVSHLIESAHDEPRIESVELGSGDSHAGGRSVALVHLTADRTVVFKPRDLSSDVALGRCARQFNALLGTQLRVPKVITRSHYGWAEFIRTRRQETSLENYPYQLGQLTGVLHALGSTDMHFENIITDEDGRPVVVDGETLLTPRPAHHESYADGSGSSRGRSLIEESVIGLGLLPLRVTVPGRKGALDVGAAGNMQEGGLSPFRTLMVQNAGRDDMYITLEPSVTNAGNANPMPGHDLAGVLSFRNAVRQGVRDVLQKILEHRSQVASLVRDCFDKVSFRFVNIPTMFYAQLLRMCSHPQLLEDPSGHLAVLGRVELRNVHRHTAAEHEVGQLLEDDVPLFTVKSTGRDLLDSHGRVMVPQFFESSPLERALDNITNLSATGVEVQSDMVDLAFVPLIPDGGETGRPLELKARPATPVDISGTTEAAAERILRHWQPARTGEHPGTFWGPVVTTADSEQWNPGTLGYDVYGGSPGIALALAEAGELFGLERYSDVARKVMTPVKSQLLRGALENQAISIGGMTGMAGTIWAIDTCDRILGTYQAENGVAMVRELTKHVREDSPADFTVGVAGALAAGCTVIHHAQKNMDSGDGVEALSQLAEACTPVLERELHRVNLAAGEDVAPARPVYTGYAHGLAGLITPLLRAGRMLASQRPEHAVQLRELGTRFTDVLISQIAPDGDVARSIGHPERSTAWCHGAPGVLLGLLGAAGEGYEVSPDILSGLERLVLERGFGNNSTYCHGDLGSLEALNVLAQEREDLAALEMWRRETRMRAQNFLRQDRTAPHRYAHTDSLMVGRAGSLHALLRTQDPNLCPNALTLE